MDSIIYYILGVNIIGFILMGVDKQKAIKQKYRIPERTFWIIALLGGALGTYFGMKRYRHKTKHKSFTIGMPIFILLNIFLFFYLS
ncbi:DUF1294 domain-containing protein [Oceanobacillus sp. Castelsardo]|uniref:DUF1294 domain-containing protein n=1 Tax=Oceanobacillus sp. Castelsardo TaxID=1851204 RepID=UPI0008393C39|nr:DUF1294 domain-containing protein [Oceanobacillus sp. Castelsardo]